MCGCSYSSRLLHLSLPVTTALPPRATNHPSGLSISSLLICFGTPEETSTSKPADNSSEIKEILKQSKEQMYALTKTILDHVRDNANNFASQINQLKMSQQAENKLHQMIGNLDNKNIKLKDDLAILDLKMHAKDEEIAELKVQNLDLNKRLLNIAEAKEHPLLERIEKMIDKKMEDLSSSIHDRLLGRRTKSQSTGPSSEQGGEGTYIGVSQEIPVTSEAEAHQQPISQQMKSFASSSSKIDFSNVASALSLPLIITNKEKQIMNFEERELSDLQKLQQEIKMQEAEKRNKADLDKDLELIWPTWDKKAITEHVRSGRVSY